MIKREFKLNLKSFLIWLFILVAMFLATYLIYPFMITDDAMKSFDEMMKIFPEEMLKAFNMDMNSISTAYGWFKTEGFMYVLLIIGFYSSILGGTILLKEESDMTIEYLNSLPITRSKIMTNKILVGMIYIVAMVLLLLLFNYVALTISCDFDQKQFFLLSLTPLLIGLPFFALNLLISTFFHNTKKSIAISLGLVFVFYILNTLSELSDKVEYLKYFSLYTLADVRNVMADVAIHPINVLLSLGLTIFFFVLSYIRYQKKELV